MNTSMMSDLSQLKPMSGSSINDRISNEAKQKTGTQLDMDDFLQLIVAQFQNQDPENAASTSEMMDSLMNMTVMQAIKDVTASTTMLYTASLVGKEVTVGEFKGNKLEEIVGTVTATGTYGGEPVIFVDGVSYSLSSLMAVGRLPEDKEDSDDTTDEKPDNTLPPVGGEDGEKPDNTLPPVGGEDGENETKGVG